MQGKREVSVLQDQVQTEGRHDLPLLNRRSSSETNFRLTCERKRSFRKFKPLKVLPLETRPFLLEFEFLCDQNTSLRLELFIGEKLPQPEIGENPEAAS